LIGLELGLEVAETEEGVYLRKIDEACRMGKAVRQPAVTEEIGFTLAHVPQKGIGVSTANCRDGDHGFPLTESKAIEEVEPGRGVADVERIGCCLRVAEFHKRDMENHTAGEVTGTPESVREVFFLTIDG
jgi:hypothetical protein